MTLTFSDDAKEDVQEIADYTFETWGDEQEQIYLSSLYRRLNEISEDPDRWKKRDDLFDGCQTALAGRHVIFFRIEGCDVFVSRILHQSMDVPRQILP
jgi:toxin ParE1/3/4